MDSALILFTLISLFGWGIGSFFAKLATNKIGNSALFWDMIGFSIVSTIYALFTFKPSVLLASDKGGMILAILAGVTGALGGVGFYTLMSMKDASVVAPLTALYPALTAILAFTFLHEQLTFVRVLGIVLATVAVVFLSV
jgi:transporter family protein